MDNSYDVMAIGAHPDDIEVVMGGTLAKLADQGLKVLLVDLCDGEPARHREAGERAKEARRAAEILGVRRETLRFQDRLIMDTVETRLAVARLVRVHRPRYVFTTLGSGVHPDHKAVTDIVVHGVFYARLLKWDEIPGGEAMADLDAHEIGRLFFGRCRMEPAWDSFHFAVDVTGTYERKLAAIAAYEAVFGADLPALRDRYAAEDRYTGALVGVRYAEVFRARSPLLVADPTVFFDVRYG